MTGRSFFCSSLLVVGMGLGTAIAQLPAGTRSIDDTSRQDAVNRQISQAETSLEKQDYKSAEAQLKTLAAANPKDGRILYDLGFAEDHIGEEADAASSYTASIAAIPGFAEPEIALGLLDARTGHTAAAHRELLDVANRSTTSAELRVRALRALAHLDESSQPAAAQEELLAALKLSPETPDDVLMGAELAERAGDPTDAETAYRRALKLMPDDLDAISGLAHVLEQQGKLGDADAAISAALKTHPDDPRVVAQAASIYAAEGKQAQAIPLLEQLRASNPKIAADPDATQLLAQLYYVNGDNSKAETLYASLLTATPKDPMLLDSLGSAQVKQGHDADAEATFKKAVALRQAFPDEQAWGESEGHLAFAASKNNDPLMCLQALDARATVLPNSPTSLFLEATAHDHLHQIKQAIVAYKAFLALANGKLPDQEFEARHRLIALEHER